MSEFLKLMIRAQAAGAQRLTFSVDLDTLDTDGHAAWQAISRGKDLPPHIAAGRTGEEALRELVTFLERIAGTPEPPSAA